MGNNITDRLKYKESIVKFSRKYGVVKAVLKFNLDTAFYVKNTKIFNLKTRKLKLL